MGALYVENGELKEKGSLVRALGVNTPDLLIRWLGGQGAASPKSSWPLTSSNDRQVLFRRFADGGIRFVRFAPFGLRPLTFKASFMDNRAKFLGAFDALVADAEKFSISLIPSLFFSQTQIPPVFSERLAAFADPKSHSRGMFESVIEAIVPRYKGSSAIALWEFGNEYDSRLGMAKPNYSVDQAMGTPAAWTEADMTPKDYCNVVTRAFRDLVRKYDATAIGSNGQPRATSSGLQGWRYFLSKRTDWPASVQERIYDDQTDTVTAHPYGGLGWYDNSYSGLMIYLSMLREDLKKQNRPLIVGEFGVAQQSDPSSSRTPEQTFEFVLSQIRDARVQLALLWNVPATKGTDAAWDFGPYGPNQNIWKMMEGYSKAWAS